MDPRPYGFYMPTPTPFKQPSPDLQYVFMREHYRMIHREIAQTQLKYFMPKVFIGFYGAILIFLSVVMIALEIASIVTKAAIYYVVGGIWGGLFGIFVAIFSLILSKSNAILVVRGKILICLSLSMIQVKKRTFKFFILAIVLNSLAIIVFFLAFDVLNAVGLGIYSLCDSQQIQCPFDINVRPLTIVKLVVGIICNLLPLIFVIYVPIRVFCHTKTTKQAIRSLPTTSRVSSKF